MAKKSKITLTGALKQLKVKDELLKRRNEEIKKLKSLLRKSNEKSLPLIDQLEKAFRDSGHEVEVDGWRENEHSNPPNDYCKWLDVFVIDKKKNRWNAHFYFTHNATKLDKMELFMTPLRPSQYDDEDTEKVF